MILSTIEEIDMALFSPMYYNDAFLKFRHVYMAMTNVEWTSISTLSLV